MTKSYNRDLRVANFKFEFEFEAAMKTKAIDKGQFRDFIFF